MTNYQITQPGKEMTDELSKLVDATAVSLDALTEKLERARGAVFDPTRTSGNFVGLAGYLNENGDYAAVEGVLINPHKNIVKEYDEMYEGIMLSGFNLDIVSETEQKDILRRINTSNPLSRLLSWMNLGSRESPLVYKSRDKPIGVVQRKDGWQVFGDEGILTPAGEPIFLRDGTAYILGEIDVFSDDCNFTGYKVL